MDIVYILKTMSLNFTQKDRVVALPCVVSDYTIAIKLNYPTDPRKNWEFPIYAVIDQRLTSVNWSWLCQKNKQNNLTCFSNCKQWGELLSSWINWSATDFRQIIQLANWRLSDIKQPKWCRFFGRRIFFCQLFSPNEVFFVPKIFFLRIWRQWRPVARTLISGRLRSASGRLFDGIFNESSQTFSIKLERNFKKYMNYSTLLFSVYFEIN